MLSDLMQFFPSLSKLGFDLSICASHLEMNCSIGRDFLNQNLYAAKVDEDGIIVTATIPTYVTIHSMLFRANEKAFPGDSYLTELLNRTPGNSIHFQATLSDGPEAYHGLQLKPKAIGICNFEDAVRKAQALARPGRGTKS